MADSVVLSGVTYDFVPDPPNRPAGGRTCTGCDADRVPDRCAQLCCVDGTWRRRALDTTTVATMTRDQVIQGLATLMDRLRELEGVR